MIELGLCMTVKNEADQIAACLDDIFDLFTEVYVVDTGSNDATVGILESRFGIRPTTDELTEERCFSLSDLRNKGFEVLKTPWILCLDADERIRRDQLKQFMLFAETQCASGYFTPWRTHNAKQQIMDYKLSFFKRGFQKLGLVHDNVQASFRHQGAQADWYSELVIEHYPPPQRSRGKHEYYEKRLHCAISKQPHWMRYFWFLGYRQFCKQEFELAEKNLSTCFASRSHLFPVEVLNSSMVLVEIYSCSNRFRTARETLTQAQQLYMLVEDDFEVKVNHGIAHWLHQAMNALSNNEPVFSPRFAY